MKTKLIIKELGIKFGDYKLYYNFSRYVYGAQLYRPTLLSSSFRWSTTIEGFDYWSKYDTYLQHFYFHVHNKAASRIFML